ncbi:MAG: hypothetical protein LUC97_04885 [Clostridiales bacterium]|nr:hypothetical protein [Clostridiales bacterium]
MLEYIKKFIGSPAFRPAFVLCGTFVLFVILACRLYSLQILNGDYYNTQIQGTTIKEISVTAPRGNIYDSLGRPLATNFSSWTVNLDASITVDNLNEVIYGLIGVLEQNGEEIEDDFPISEEKPYTFLLDGSETREKRWKRDMSLDEGLNASECFYALRDSFDIDPSLSDGEARKILSLRSKLYRQRYSKYVPVVVSKDVSQETISYLEENLSNFPSVYIDAESLREYPEGELFSHILGYIRTISDTQLEEYEQYGYTLNDIIGQDGIEKAFELELNGTDGTELVEVDSVGRRISTYTEGSVAPVPGNNVFLTLDAELQRGAYEDLKEVLANTLISRLTGNSEDYTFNITEMGEAMVEGGSVNIEGLLEAEDGYCLQLGNFIRSADAAAAEDSERAAEILSDAISVGDVTVREVLLCMFEQGALDITSSWYESLENGEISATAAVVGMLGDGTMEPSRTKMDPCTGSVVVSDVNTGDILVSVSYPSYDNNELVNNFNNEYYDMLRNDSSTPLVNRPFTEPRAPGSTFKMITLFAGLEEGIITRNQTIYDEGTFTKAGLPYARCWINSGNGSHGSVNPVRALEVSCNYFFYELSYRMGNARNGTTEQGIATLNSYMEKFGLNSPTGVEIYELYDSRGSYPTNLSSPEYKKYIYEQRYPDADESESNWYDGDTIRTAIGQSYNNYTNATLNKYVATVANGGKRYSLHFLDKVTNYDDSEEIYTYTPNLELDLELDPENVETVHRGMYQVGHGSSGTLRGYFSSYEVPVAVKSGTAQESTSRAEHTIFVGYAPYDDPKISVSIIIPFGNDSETGPAPNLAKKIISRYMNLESASQKEYYNTLTR